MADRRQARVKTRAATRQNQKEEKELVKETSVKSFAFKSVGLVIMRLLIVIILIVAATIVGAMVGYGVIGNGEVLDVFKMSTWTHVLDILSGTEKK